LYLSFTYLPSKTVCKCPHSNKSSYRKTKVSLPYLRLWKECCFCNPAIETSIVLLVYKNEVKFLPAASSRHSLLVLNGSNTPFLCNKFPCKQVYTRCLGLAVKDSSKSPALHEMWPPTSGTSTRRVPILRLATQVKSSWCCRWK